MSNVETSLSIGNRFPYDGNVPSDNARITANAVLADLAGRGGIGNELEQIELDIRPEIVDSLSEIIRTVMAEEAPAVDVATVPTVTIPDARELVINAVVSIANRHGYDSALSPLDACHATAKEVLEVFDGQYPGIPQMLIFPAPSEDFKSRHADDDTVLWDNIVPLNRRGSEGGTSATHSLGEDYDIVRMRSANAALVMFG